MFGAPQTIYGKGEERKGKLLDQSRSSYLALTFGHVVQHLNFWGNQEVCSLQSGVVRKGRIPERCGGKLPPIDALRVQNAPEVAEADQT